MSLEKVEKPDGLSPAELLRGRGLRPTGPRVAILEALREDRRHPTPEQILTSLRERHPSLSLSTVYQNLMTFLRVGLCRRVSSRDGRLRVDGTAHDHDHAVCRVCGKVFDLERHGHAGVPAGLDLPAGAVLLGVRVEYDVLCGDCTTGVGPGRATETMES